MQARRLALYASCNFDQDMSNGAAKERWGRFLNLNASMEERMAFLVPELMQCDMDTFNAYCKEEPELERYRHLAEDIFSRKEHVLDTNGEEILSRMNDLAGTYGDIYDDLTVNDTEYPTIDGSDGEKVGVTEAGYGSALLSPDRDFRKRYFEALLGTYGKHMNTISSNYSAAVRAKVYLAKSRKYPSARASALADNFVPEEVYDNLIENVRAGVGPLQDYVSLRKKILGISDFHFYDFFVPIVPDVDRSYSYEEGKELVLKAAAILGEDYTTVMKRAVNERWIDVLPGKNKRTGAYSNSCYDEHPYMLLNYTDTLEDVFTLIHELGHSMHSYFSNQNQPVLDADYSIFCAEVASTTNEMLLYHYLLERAETMEDIITIESAISVTEQAIEDLSGTLRGYDAQVAYSTVNLTLREVYRLSNGEEPAENFGGRLSGAFSAGWRGFLELLENLAVALAYGWVLLVLLAAAGTGVVLVLRRRKKTQSPPERTAEEKKDDKRS